MSSPLQVLFFMAITLAPSGTHHVVVTAGNEAYSWEKGDKVDAADTWVYDWRAACACQALKSNWIVPNDVSQAEREVVKSTHRDGDKCFVLRFDNAHQLEKNSEGYVYVVRPGSPNEKDYSFKFE